MKTSAAIAEILKREGVKELIAYPVNPIIEAAAVADIRTIIVRQERIGLHMADAISRVTSGNRIGAFAMQYGPGCENAFGGVAQAYADSVPLVVIGGGYPRNIANIPPNFSAFLNYQHITKSAEQIPMGSAVPEVMRRAFTQAKNGRPGPVLVEVPRDVWDEDVPEPLDYTPTSRARTVPEPQAIKDVAKLLIQAKRPVIYAGQGVHYASAWQELKDLAELLEIPVTTSLEGKSAFPEDHPLYLGSGGRTFSKTVQHFLQEADVIFGIGCSFTRTTFGTPMPAGKTIVHSTVDSAHLNKDVPASYALLGDAKLTLQALIAEINEALAGKKPESSGNTVKEIEQVNAEWMEKWMPKLTSDQVPFTPYRVIWDIMNTIDRKNTIITHDSGSPRDQMTPFWKALAPMTYIGWGKSTQLGYGLGLAMGAKLAAPDKLCINVMGDAAIGMTGMDFETAVRERIPILTVLLNNYCMAIELPIMQVATEKYRSTDISGNYADMAKAFGGYGERVTELSEIVPALKRAIQKTEEGTPALLEFITSKEIDYSLHR